MMRHAILFTKTALLVLLLAIGSGCDEDTTSDAGPDPSDAGSDAGSDAASPPTDAGVDSGTPSDAGPTDSGPPGDAGPAALHALITEIGLLPAGAEIIEIMNPGSSEIALDDVYLSDNSAYHQITSGAWSPGGTPQTDWLVRFPAGATLAAGAVAVIALSPDYESVWSACPDYIIDPAESALSCSGSSVPAMRIPTNGTVGTSVGSLLSNAGEMVVLFTWDGSAANVQDIDYVTWDADADADTHVDKTGIGSYAPDTAEISQVPAAAPPADQTIERCDASEPSETPTGGNGVDGHDETSENMGAAFSVATTPSPGTRNACL